MKNRDIVHCHEEVEIYRHYYKPSFNVWRFTRSILGVIFGSPTVPSSYSNARKRNLR